MVSYPAILTLALLPRVNARLFTVVNTCSFTIWPAIYTDLSVAQNVPPFPTGWESPPYTSAQFAVPDNWKAGRIWGRRGCNFTTNSGPTACLDGGCNGGLQCDPYTGTPVPPVTVAEWTLQGDGNNDFYDVSLAGGFNLPMAIIPSASGCSVASCPVDLNPQCPQPLIGPLNSTGAPVGCKSACEANLDNPADSANCCTGSHNTATSCPSSGVQYYSYFKGSCPDAWVYAYDESSGTALWTCGSAVNSGYQLTFCPPPTGGQAAAPISAVPASLIPTGTFTPSSSTSTTSTTSNGGSATSSSISTNAASQPSTSSNSNSTSGTPALLRAMTPWAPSLSCAVAGWLLAL